MFQKKPEWPIMGFREFAKAVDFYTRTLGFEKSDDDHTSGLATITLDFHGVFLHLVEGDPGPHDKESQHVRKPSMMTPRRWIVGPVEFAWDTIEEATECPATPPTLYLPLLGGDFSILEGIEGVETQEQIVGPDYQAIQVRDCEGNQVQFFHDCAGALRPEHWYWGWPSQITFTPKPPKGDGKKMRLIIFTLSS